MRNSQNPFESTQQGLNNWRTQPRSQGMSEIQRKKTDFHKEIRKQQLQDIFRAKRKILLEDLAKMSTNGFQTEKKTLMSCYKAIAQNEKVHENICALVNLLALQKPFERYSSTQSNPSPVMIEKYCTNLINLLLKKVIPSFSNQPKSRITCFNAIANLFADQMCENVRYVKIVVQTLNEKYGDIDTWGCNQEMVEIYYMIANLQRKTIVNTDLMSVEKLLGWGESGILNLSSDALKALMQGFTKLFSDVDEMFNPRHQRSFYTDHFRASRQIIIQNMIKRLISTGQGNKLYANGDLSLDPLCIGNMLKFMGKNKIYVLKVVAQWQQDMEDRKKVKQFCDRLLGLINQPTLKTVTLREIGGFLINLLAYYPQQMQPMQQTNNIMSNNNHHHFNSTYTNPLSQQIDYLNSGIKIVSRQFLTSQTITQIMINICHQSFQCKIIYLKIVHELMLNIQRSLQLKSQKQLEQVLQFIMVDKRLEDILSDFLAEMHAKLKQVDLLRMILDIYHLVVRVTEGKLGHKLKQHLHSLLQSTPQFIPTDIFEIMEELYMMHEEKQQSTII